MIPMVLRDTGTGDVLEQMVLPAFKERWIPIPNESVFR